MLSYTTLQEGYKALKSLTNARKDSLQKDLQGGKTILAADSDWLDIDANLIDEEVALEPIKPRNLKLPNQHQKLMDQVEKLSLLLRKSR